MIKKLQELVLNEMENLIIFPKSGSSYQIKYVLRQYYGLNNTQINKILNLDSRYVLVKKNYPLTVVSEHRAYTL